MYNFTSPDGHSGTIKPVQKRDGPMAGKWIARVSGPRVTGSSGIKSIYSEPNLVSARERIAQFLGISPSQVRESPLTGGSTTASTSSPLTASSPSRSAVPKVEASLLSTPPPASSSARSDPSVFDKYESSPNNMATCRGCHVKITKGSRRIGLREYSETYQRYQYAYYHENCCPAHKKNHLCLPSSPNRTLSSSTNIDQVLQDELAYQHKQSVQKTTLIQQRHDLRESLRQLRLAFARRLGWSAFCVFDDKTLDDLVVQMPRTKTECLQVYGMGPKRFQNFGTSILCIVERYHDLYHHPSTSRRSMATALAAAGSSGNGNEGDTVVSSSVQVEAVLSCEEIVKQKFEEAEKNGYVISI